MIEYADAKKVAGMLAAVAEPTRLLILYRLAQGPQHVGALAEAVGVPMVNMSHHLGVMRQAGILDDEKDGRRVVYRIHPGVTAPARDADTLATLRVGPYLLHVRTTGGPAAKPKKTPAKPPARTRAAK